MVYVSLDAAECGRSRTVVVCSCNMHGMHIHGMHGVGMVHTLCSCTRRLAHASMTCNSLLMLLLHLPTGMRSRRLHGFGRPCAWHSIPGEPSQVGLLMSVLWQFAQTAQLQVHSGHVAYICKALQNHAHAMLQFSGPMWMWRVHGTSRACAQSHACGIR